MYITYQPEDGQKQRWHFDPKRVRASKAEMIEKRFGQNWAQWLQVVQAGGTKARRVLLWHLLTLEHPAMRFDDTPDFMVDELEVEHELHELRDIRERVAKANLPDDEKEPIFAGLDGEITEAMAREEAEEGKATSSNGESTTPSPSRSSSESALGSNASS